jgi:hypothetical protein
MEIKAMNDEQRKAIVIEYFKRLDRGGNLLDLFDDYAGRGMWQGRDREIVFRSDANSLKCVA